MKKYRDYDLDKLRGLAMIYIMFIHTIYGVGLFKSPPINIIKSYFLIEMPVFFFIAGASNYYSKYNSKVDFYKKKFKRILIPYYVFAFLMILMNFLVPELLNNKYDFSIVYWLMPISNKQQSFYGYFVWPLWFISVYLVIMVLFPYYKSYYENKDKEKSLDIYLPLFYIFLSILIIDLYGVVINIFIKKIIVYSFFVYLGLFWDKIKNIKESKKYNIQLIILFISSLILYVFLMFTGYFSINMEISKNEVDLTFMIYGIAGISFLLLIYKYLIKVVDFICRFKVFGWIFKQYKDNTYTIFFFHMLSLYIIHLLFESGMISISNDYVIFIIRMVILIPLSALFGFLFGFIERLN